MSTEPCPACPAAPGLACRALAGDTRNAAICGYVAAGRPKWIAWVQGDEAELARLRRAGKPRVALGQNQERR